LIIETRFSKVIIRSKSNIQQMLDFVLVYHFGLFFSSRNWTDQTKRQIVFQSPKVKLELEKGAWAVLKGTKWNVRGICLLIVSLSIGMFCLFGCDAKEQNAGVEGQVKAVKVMKVAAGENPVSLEYVGTVDAKELVKYSFKMNGQIKKIYVAEGDQVKRGDLLAELDTTDLDFQLSAAKATLDTAKVNVSKAKDAADYAESLYKKTESLYQNGVVTEDSWEQVQLKRNTAASEYLQAQSQYSSALTDYNYKSDLVSNSKIVAEQDGYVVEKVFNENERVSAFSPVIIVRSGAQVINIGIPQQELSKISVGSSAKVVVDGDSTQGTVTSISELPDETTRTYKAEITVSDKIFRLGSIANVSVDVGKQTGIWIPLTSIFSDGGENCVYVVKNERALKRTIEIQSVSDDHAKVTGLRDGELLVISGMNNLVDGARVKEQK